MMKTSSFSFFSSFTFRTSFSSSPFNSHQFNRRNICAQTGKPVIIKQHGYPNYPPPNVPLHKGKIIVSKGVYVSPVKNQIMEEIENGKVHEIPAKRRLSTILQPVQKFRRNEEIPGIIIGKGKPRVLITIPFRFIQSHRDRDMFRRPNWGKKYYLNIDSGEKELVVPHSGQVHPRTNRTMHVVFRRVDNIHELPNFKKFKRQKPNLKGKKVTKSSKKDDLEEEREPDMDSILSEMQEEMPEQQ